MVVILVETSQAQTEDNRPEGIKTKGYDRHGCVEGENQGAGNGLGGKYGDLAEV